MDFRKPEATRISEEPSDRTLGQNAGPGRMLGPILLIPFTRMSFLQFSEVSWVHRCPSTHQSQGKAEETQLVQEVKLLQSKKLKSVATKSGPSSNRVLPDSLVVSLFLTDSLLVKWDSPLGMVGSKSFLRKKTTIKKECQSNICKDCIEIANIKKSV